MTCRLPPRTVALGLHRASPALPGLLALGRIGDGVVVVALDGSLGLPPTLLQRLLRRVGRDQTIAPVTDQVGSLGFDQASRTVNQFSGLKNCINARCILRSRMPLATWTGLFVKGSIPV